jgi:SH3-like domain-containing protein
MKRKLFVVAALISTLFCCPAFAQEKTSQEIDIKENYKVYAETVENLTPEFAELISNGKPEEMYSIGNNVNVRKEPNTNCEVLGKLLKYTTVEAIAEYDNWTCITTQDGIAFVYSDYLRGIELMQKPTGANRWNIKLTPEEYDLVARIGQLECGGECDLGQQAVFEVIFNRVYHGKYPNSAIGVLSQKGQFSTWRNRSIGAATPSERILGNINLVLSGKTEVLPFETVYFSRGAQNSRVQARIGDHVFCNY